MILVDLATPIVVLEVVVLPLLLIGHLAVLVVVDLVIMVDMVVAMIIAVVMGVLAVGVLLVIEESHHMAILVALVPIWEPLVGGMLGVG